MEKINNDYLLSIKTKKFINQIFESYNGLTGKTDSNTAIRVPRGIGISAYLSELFMRNVDNQIQELDDIIYYARYVDDIIAIFVPQSKREKNLNYKEKIEELVEKIEKPQIDLTPQSYLPQEQKPEANTSELAEKLEKKTKEFNSLNNDYQKQREALFKIFDSSKVEQVGMMGRTQIVVQLSEEEWKELKEVL